MAVVDQAGLAVERAQRETAADASARERSPEGRLAAMMLGAETLELRDAGTAEHSPIVGTYARHTALALGLDPERVERIHAAGVLHDLGKLGSPTPSFTSRARSTTPSGRRCIATARSAPGSSSTPAFGTSRYGSAPTTSGSTGAAIPRASVPARSRSRRASSRWPAPTRRWSPTAPTGPRCPPSALARSSSGAPAASSTRPWSRRSSPRSRAPRRSLPPSRWRGPRKSPRQRHPEAASAAASTGSGTSWSATGREFVRAMRPYTAALRLGRRRCVPKSTK